MCVCVRVRARTCACPSQAGMDPVYTAACFFVCLFVFNLGLSSKAPANSVWN